MKAVFGILALVIVLAIVGSLGKRQLQAIGGGESAGRNAAAAKESGAFAADAPTRRSATALPGATAADPNVGTVPQQARSMQERARADTVRALDQGEQRNRRAEP